MAPLKMHAEDQLIFKAEALLQLFQQGRDLAGHFGQRALLADGLIVMVVEARAASVEASSWLRTLSIQAGCWPLRRASLASSR